MRILDSIIGSKGVVSLILPDTEMPYDSDGIPVDCIMNPHAVISRKNLSQSCEILLTKIADKVFFLNDMLLNDENFDEIRSNLKKYRLFQYFKMTDDELKEYHENNSTYSYITGAFSKINVPTVMEWMKELGIEEGIDLWDGKTRKRIRNKILVGDMYMMKLYFLSNAYSKVTETRVPGLGTLVLGQGSITRSGSKFGNMEMDALQANNIMEVVEDQKFDDVYSAGWFLAHSILTGLIFKLKDKDEDAD